MTKTLNIWLMDLEYIAETEGHVDFTKEAFKQLCDEIRKDGIQAVEVNFRSGVVVGAACTIGGIAIYKLGNNFRKKYLKSKKED